MDLLEALRSYQQADEDGVMVLVSRQACDEAAAEIERLRDCLSSIRKAVSISEPSALAIAVIATCDNGLNRTK